MGPGHAHAHAEAAGQARVDIRQNTNRGLKLKARHVSRQENASLAVKFTWFNLLPWPYLPDDFRQTYRSVWVDIPSRLYGPVRGHAVYHQYMDQLEYADAPGFDG
ncbi:MAG TPA: hypothetical protein VGK33_19995, partial [Chloroflexota bacterium]